MQAVTKALIGGGGYAYIRVLPDEFLLKSVIITVDFKRNSSAKREYMHEYVYPPINALVTALPICYLATILDKIVETHERSYVIFVVFV